MVRKREDGRWEGRIVIGHKENGDPIFRYIYADTQKELTAKLRQNITAYQGERLIGCLRILSDGYYFGTITELLVLPEFQKQGIGSQLLNLAKTHAPTLLYFGAQPEAQALSSTKSSPRSFSSSMSSSTRMTFSMPSAARYRS